MASTKVDPEASGEDDEDDGKGSSAKEQTLPMSEAPDVNIAPARSGDDSGTGVHSKVGTQSTFIPFVDPLPKSNFICFVRDGNHIPVFTFEALELDIKSGAHVLISHTYSRLHWLYLYWYQSLLNQSHSHFLQLFMDSAISARHFSVHLHGVVTQICCSTSFEEPGTVTRWFVSLWRV